MEQPVIQNSAQLRIAMSAGNVRRARKEADLLNGSRLIGLQWCGKRLLGNDQ
jgi:hypothetical protein